MPRRPRIHLANLPLHIVQRGHNRDACFFAEEDYHAYRHWLGEALKSTCCLLHAYVQMTNHVHLLLTPPEPEAVSQLVISLGRRYVQYINKTHHRTGTLWDSRYKSSLVQADDYLLLCQRYIELNPVRADMVDDPAHYRCGNLRDRPRFSPVFGFTPGFTGFSRARGRSGQRKDPLILYAACSIKSTCTESKGKTTLPSSVLSRSPAFSNA